MFNRKSIIEILFVSLVIIILGFQIGITQDSYYYGLGKQPLNLSKSVISIKFASGIAPQYSEAFAFMIPELDESYPAEPMYIGFDVYHLKNGQDNKSILKLLKTLNKRPDIQYAYPAYLDSVNSLMALNDQFVIRYNESVDQKTIDRIERKYAVELVRGPSEYTGMRVMRVTPKSHGTCLDVANKFYESDIVAYSHPDFANVILHNNDGPITTRSHDNYYYGLGQQPLYKCDSIITIKFDPSVPTQHSNDFIHMVEAIDESYLPEPMYIGFDVYHIETGNDIDSLLEILNERPDIQYAYSSYYDSTGFTLKLNDYFNIKYHETVSQTTIDSIENLYSVGLVRGPSEHTGLRVLCITPESPGTCLDIANIFFESGLVYYSHPDFACVELHDFEPDDPLFEYQYNLHNEGQTGGTPGIDIGMKKAWEMSTGLGQRVAIIDDGFIRVHEDIDMDLVDWASGRDFIGGSVKTPIPDNDPRPGENLSHGVACQGIISAKLNNGIGISGIAPDCTIIPIKIGDDGGFFPGIAGLSIIADAIEYAADCPAYILSCSWGWPPQIYYQEIVDAIDYASSFWNRICVFSAGNSGSSNNPSERLVGFPANLPTTIAVGAIKKDGSRWMYSSYGSNIDVVAPSGYAAFDAGDIYTLDQPGDFGYNPQFVSCMNTTTDYLCSFGGTSAAAPQVAGIVALLKSRGGGRVIGIDAVREILAGSAIDGIGDTYDTPGFDEYYGYGLASASRALLAVSRGDVNNDGAVEILDIVFLINYKFKEGDPILPDVALGDTDCNGLINIIDIVTLINHLYKGADAPPFCFIYDYPEEE